MVEQAVKAIAWSREYTDNISFPPRMPVAPNWIFLCRIFDAVIRAGATTINVPDTVVTTFLPVCRDLAQGYRTGAQFRQRSSGRCIAITISAWPWPARSLPVLSGARQVECTVNGLGERAGNASRRGCDGGTNRADIFPVARIDTTRSCPLPVGIADYRLSGAAQQGRGGRQRVAHESGIHQDGVLKHRETYEIMRAQDVGWTQNKLVLGKAFGRNAFKTRLSELGIELDSDEALNAAFAGKELADKKHEIFDEDLHALVSDEVVTPTRNTPRLVYSHVCSETEKMPTPRSFLTLAASRSAAKPTVAVRWMRPSRLSSIVGSGAELLLYSVNAITTGTDAREKSPLGFQGERIVNGSGADTDIVIASARSYLNA